VFVDIDSLLLKEQANIYVLHDKFMVYVDTFSSNVCSKIYSVAANTTKVSVQLDEEIITMESFGIHPCLLNVVFISPPVHLDHQVPKYAVMELSPNSGPCNYPCTHSPVHRSTKTSHALVYQALPQASY
jgi:hypothetical protein